MSNDFHHPPLPRPSLSGWERPLTSVSKWGQDPYSEPSPHEYVKYSSNTNCGNPRSNAYSNNSSRTTNDVSLNNSKLPSLPFTSSSGMGSFHNVIPCYNKEDAPSKYTSDLITQESLKTIHNSLQIVYDDSTMTDIEDVRNYIEKIQKNQILPNVLTFQSLDEEEEEEDDKSSTIQIKERSNSQQLEVDQNKEKEADDSFNINKTDIVYLHNTCAFSHTGSVLNLSFSQCNNTSIKEIRSNSFKTKRNPNSLIFNSHFEGGNLYKAIEVSPTEYDLFVHSDTNTKSCHTQWFYFSVSNTKADTTVKFNIINCCKNPNLIRSGMTPAVFSVENYNSFYIGWSYSTTNTSYVKNNVQRRTGVRTIGNKSLEESQRILHSHQSSNPYLNDKREKPSNGVSSGKHKHPFYTYTFYYTFKFDDDVVYFSLYKPYTIRRMSSLLKSIQNRLKRRAIRTRVLSKNQLFSQLYRYNVKCNGGISSQLENAFEKTVDLLPKSKDISRQRSKLKERPAKEIYDPSQFIHYNIKTEKGTRKHQYERSCPNNELAHFNGQVGKENFKDPELFENSRNAFKKNFLQREKERPNKGRSGKVNLEDPISYFESEQVTPHFHNYARSQLPSSTVDLDSPPILSTNEDWISRLNSDFPEEIEIETKQFIYRQQILCYTETGLAVPIITITSNTKYQKRQPTSVFKGDDFFDKDSSVLNIDFNALNHGDCLSIKGLQLKDKYTCMNGLKIKEKKYVLITSRVHAGETSSSYAVEGLIKSLLSKDEVYQNLRTFYIFIICPMLNPDGVILGNFRNSFSGYDLNRCWASPTPQHQPTIFYLKTYLKKLKSTNKELFMYCDLHGHSKMMNSFMYACHKAADQGFCSWTKVRLLPRLVAKRTHLFNFHDCSFKITPDKINTARVVIWKEFNITNSFTLEISQYGYSLSNAEVFRFMDQHFYIIGDSLLQSILEYTVLLVDLNKEFNINGGWLKPNRLIELTGTPAADLMAKDMAEDRQEIKRRERQEKIKGYVRNKRENNVINSNPSSTNTSHITPVSSSYVVQRANPKYNMNPNPSTLPSINSVNNPTNPPQSLPVTSKCSKSLDLGPQQQTKPQTQTQKNEEEDKLQTRNQSTNNIRNRDEPKRRKKSIFGEDDGNFRPLKITNCIGPQFHPSYENPNSKIKVFECPSLDLKFNKIKSYVCRKIRILNFRYSKNWNCVV